MRAVSIPQHDSILRLIWQRTVPRRNPRSPPDEHHTRFSYPTPDVTTRRGRGPARPHMYASM